MTYDKDIFKKVGLGDGYTLDAVGMGKVEVVAWVSRNQSKLYTMHDVLYVPAMKVNLFSVRSAAEKNLIIQFGHTRCWFKNKLGKLRATGTLIDKLYYLDIVSGDHCASVASDIWHQRLGHIGTETLQRAFRDDSVLGVDLSNVHVDICEPCIKAKMSRRPFKLNSMRIKTTRPLELVHSDVCGPMQVDSVGGSRYFVSFIDDFIRYAFVYFLREKAEIFDIFKQFEALVSNRTDSRIGTLHTDGGGEYVSNDFEQYLVTQGIHHQLTVRYSPEQNGVAERYNRTICESARAMVFRANLSKRFWAEAVVTAVYTRNRLPTKAVPEKTTPYELWFKAKPDISHFKVFGCVGYSHIPDQLRQKLDSKAETMLFVGYSTNSKGYRLFDPKTNKIAIRRDVVFNESKFGLHDDQTVTTTDNLTVDVTSPIETVCSERKPAEPRRSTRQVVPRCVMALMSLLVRIETMQHTMSMI